MNTASGQFQCHYLLFGWSTVQTMFFGQISHFPDLFVSSWISASARFVSSSRRLSFSASFLSTLLNVSATPLRLFSEPLGPLPQLLFFVKHRVLSWELVMFSDCTVDYNCDARSSRLSVVADWNADMFEHLFFPPDGVVPLLICAGLQTSTLPERNFILWTNPSVHTV